MFVPATLATHTVESLQCEQARAHRWTYWTLLAAVFLGLALLPWVDIDLTVRARGVVRPVTDRIELRAAASGRLAAVWARENDRVAAGQPLLAVATADLDERAAHNRSVREGWAIELADLERLIAAVGKTARGDASPADPGLVTDALAREFTLYAAESAAARLAAGRARTACARMEALAGHGIATQQELDNARYEAEHLAAAEGARREARLADWASRRRDLVRRMAAQDSEARRLVEERADAVICAPVDGVLLDFAGWAVGGRVVAGQPLGTVTPDDALLVEAQVGSAEVGRIAPGQRVRLQVDAYPHTYWGSLGGIVTAVSEDQVAAPAHQSGAAFRVRILPDALELRRASGASVRLRKGLALTARFVVGRRSLWDLLQGETRGWFENGSGST